MAARKTPAANPVYQFKITLLDVRPPIWRRILVPDGSLDELHEWVQTAMGWTNSHLHQFEIRGRVYGDVEMLDDGFGDIEFIDSVETNMCDLVGKNRLLRKFKYTYDFGDDWEHEIEFEGIVPREKGAEVPSLHRRQTRVPVGRCPRRVGLRRFSDGDQRS